MALDEFRRLGGSEAGMSRKRKVAQGLAVEQRRLQIAAMLVRKPAITQRQIERVLAANGTVNPETKAAYSLGTINGDIKAIKREWMERRRQDADEWVAGELAKLDALEELGWQSNSPGVVFKAMEMRGKYLRLFNPLDIGDGEPVMIAVVRANVDAL